MQRDDVDILLITYRRPFYARMSIERLLRQADDRSRVWLWHNGQDDETLALTKSFASHPRVYRFHHSPENQRLAGPTNWLWQNAEGAFLSKVDDDCLQEDGWIDRLRAAHAAEPRFGVIGAWRFQDEDFLPRHATKKIRTFGGGTQLLVNTWVQGSGYLMKRTCMEQGGLLPVDAPSFSQYCSRLSQRGWVNGFPFPFLREDHMDDPRSPHTLLKTNADLADHVPLGVQQDGVRTIEGWLERVRWNAYMVQTAPMDARWQRGWRLRLRMLAHAAKRATGLTDEPGPNPRFRRGA
jgi:glycosyltransferase involved in cell wall biosynthesis